MNNKEYKLGKWSFCIESCNCKRCGNIIENTEPMFYNLNGHELCRLCGDPIPMRSEG